MLCFKREAKRKHGLPNRTFRGPPSKGLKITLLQVSWEREKEKEKEKEREKEKEKEKEKEEEREKEKERKRKRYHPTHSQPIFMVFKVTLYQRQGTPLLRWQPPRQALRGAEKRGAGAAAAAPNSVPGDRGRGRADPALRRTRGSGGMGGGGVRGGFTVLGSCFFCLLVFCFCLLAFWFCSFLLGVLQNASFVF